MRPDGTEAYATFYTPNNLAWAGEGQEMPGGYGVDREKRLNDKIK